MLNPSGPIPRAKATLVYVPGLGHDTLNSAEVIAQSIAAKGTGYGAELSSENERPPPATKGLRAVATVSRGSDRVLDVMELDYREALEKLSTSDGKEGVAPSLFVQGWYAMFGFGLAVKALRQDNKSLKAQIQLILGTAGAVVLFVSFLLALIGFITTLLMAWDVQVPAWASSSAPWIALFGGLVSAATLGRWRKNLLRSGRRVQQLLRYFNEESEREKITDCLKAALDALKSSGYKGDIHVLAYSFGSIVALDTYTCTGTPPEDLADVPDGVKATTSLVTVGCPHDFVALYMPTHFATRKRHRTNIPWHNVFVASDVFGSNFREDKKSDTEAGQPNTDMDWSVTNHRHLHQEELTWGRVLLGIGLRRHNKYWHQTGGCWQPLLKLWGLTEVASPITTTDSARQS
jgi:hypothetical protein